MDNTLQWSTLQVSIYKKMAAITSFSIAALRPLGSGAIWRTIVKRQRPSEIKLAQRVHHASSKTGKGRLAYVSLKSTALIRLSKEYFPVFTQCAVWPRHVGEWGHSQIFGEIWGNFPVFPKIGGRGDESKHGILKLHYRTNYQRAAHLPVLRYTESDSDVISFHIWFSPPSCG